MTEKKKCSCGNIIQPGSNFCSSCGKPLSATVFCPHCRRNVNPDNFCSKCGGSLRDNDPEPRIRDTVWERGQTDFAISVPSSWLDPSRGTTLEVRQGTKALFFEDGRLVEIAESGRYSTGEGGLLYKLFKKKKALSAVLVDAGDVTLPFSFQAVRTKDGLFIDVELDIVLRLEDPNAFFVNVMKERKAFKIHDLRQMLFSEIQNALQEGIGKYDFHDINTNKTTKDEIASRMEAHLRQTFGKIGLGFGQIRAFSVSQKVLDETARMSAEAEAAARTIEAGAGGEQRVGRAELDAENARRRLRRDRIPGAREDVDIEVEEEDVRLGRKRALDGKAIEEELLDAAFYERRIEIYKRLLRADTEKIKTEEDFRKFRQAIDRDRLLDEAEWKQFRDEILWQAEDRNRDREFLVRKIKLQQEYDLKRLELVNRKELSLEEKRLEMQLLDEEQKGVLKRELERMEGIDKILQAKAKARLATEEIQRIGKKEIEIQEKMKDLELKRAEFQQALEQEEKKAAVRHEIAKLDIEEKRLKSELGMSNLERIKAIKRQDQYEKMVMQREDDLERLNARLREEEARHRMRLEEMREKRQLEIDRMTVLSGLNTEQLISVSNADQARILGDLARSRTLKGMSAEEILAMKDPAALGKALAERAHNTQSEDLKAMYERMLAQSEQATDKIARAHEKSADRAERMSGETLRAMGGQGQRLAAAERASADRAERMFGKGVDGLGRAAGSGTGADGGAGPSATVVKCSHCRREVDEGENFCPNCGHKMY